jgi:hypothetical protein
MRTHQINLIKINLITSKVLIVLSFTALLAVLSGYFQPPQPDEGAAAHIFQLSIVALMLMILLFFATADWKVLRGARDPWPFQPVLWLSHLEHCITSNTTAKPASRRSFTISHACIIPARLLASILEISHSCLFCAL